MGELIPYLKTLHERGFSISYRELKSRFIREDPKVCIRRVMDLCEKHDSVFTFCIVGVTAKDNPNIIKEIISRGHEIACHGYEHVRFDLLSYDKVCEDLIKARELFSENFNYELKGFRAPYLKTSDIVNRALFDLGFIWSSSIEENNANNQYSSDIIELPIVLDDWEILIKRNQSSDGLFKAMEDNANNGTVFLLHPWRVGQKKYIGALEMFFDKVKYPCVSTQELVQSKKGIALTGDVGEMSLIEIAKRVLM